MALILFAQSDASDNISRFLSRRLHGFHAHDSDSSSQCTLKPTTTTVQSHAKRRIQLLISRYVDRSDSPM
ncbi:hypothetical protein WN944_008573 [Citrus x changshan-huyou]|uniref:Uncharacterized protein n=1 Tax=Citrus x changshan-huyou TaxID=2935761 RepID=A0AAP0MQH8_9ROSI